jgi:uroporphyrinogen-III synthase
LATSPLAGRGIVVTRPREQAARLAALLEAAGARALVFPAIEIADAADPAPARRIIGRLAEFDLAAFVSPTAVSRAFRLIGAWPAGLRAAAVGSGSARELARHGVQQVIAPAAGADSEALLATPEMAQVRGKRIVVFRGEGGRELLGETLKARGAVVEYAEIYRRARPATDVKPLLAAWGRQAVHAVTITSAAGLRNLFEMLGEAGGEGGAQRLRATPLFAGHERIAAEARRLGVLEVMVAGVSDDEMLARLVAYFGGA